MISRYLPLVGVLIFLAVAVGWRSWLQLRRHGTSGLLLFRSGNRAQITRDSLALVWLALFVGQAIAVAVAPDWLPPDAFGPLSDVLRATGAVLFFGGLVLLVTAQLDLGASWRIGIDEAAKPGLVTEGLYRFSRNPIYLALLIVLTGYTLLIPTLLSLVLLLATYIGVRRQASAEEEYLARTYGDAYRDYARRVGRLVPGIGRHR